MSISAHTYCDRRLLECAAEGERDSIARSLLSAYVACLQFDELVETTIRFLAGPQMLRRALRSRLTRQAAKTAPELLDQLADRLLNLAPQDRLAKTTRETLLSHLYPSLPLSARQAVLEHWIGMGTRQASHRWLKAIEDDDQAFDEGRILAFWRSTADPRAAKLLAYQATPEHLRQILSELVADTAEGWIISRAVLRAGGAPEEAWEVIKESFPASYLYLCAMTGRAISDEEALALVFRVPGWPGSERGLALWAVGEMGLISVLDAVRSRSDELQHMDHQAMGIVLLDGEDGS